MKSPFMNTMTDVKKMLSSINQNDVQNEKKDGNTPVSSTLFRESEMSDPTLPSSAL